MEINKDNKVKRIGIPSEAKIGATPTFGKHEVETKPGVQRRTDDASHKIDETSTLSEGEIESATSVDRKIVAVSHKIDELKDNRGFALKLFGVLIPDVDAKTLSKNFEEVKKIFEKYKKFGIKIPEDILWNFERSGHEAPLLGSPAYLTKEQAEELKNLASEGERMRRETIPPKIASGEIPSAETQSTISQLKTQLEQQEVEIERLNTVLDEAAEEALEYSELQTAHQDLKTAYKKFDEFNNTLMQKLENAIESNEYAYADVEFYKRLAEEKVFQVEDLKNENTKLEQQVKESTKNIAKVQGELDQLKTQIETLKTTNADLSRKNRSYIAEQETAVKNQMKMIIGKELGKKPELKSIAREQELDKQNKELYKELKETHQELEELKRFKLADDKINQSLKNENLNLANESKRLSAKNAKLAEEIEKLKAGINKLQE